jgi:succinate dehydrogenase/fumarate reductase cytochrome b subunit
VIDYSPSFKITGRRLFYPVVAHIIISLYLFIKDRRKNVRRYSDLISETNQQMVTGIGIVVFVSLHIISYMFPPANFYYDFGRGLVQVIIDGMMFTSICLHLRISIPRLLVSFGMLESKNSYSNFKRKFSIAILVILVILIFADVVRFGVLM